MRVILSTLLFTLLVVACNGQPIKTLSADVRKLAEKTSREEAIKQIVIETAPPKK